MGTLTMVIFEKIKWIEFNFIRRFYVSVGHLTQFQPRVSRLHR